MRIEQSVGTDGEHPRPLWACRSPQVSVFCPTRELSTLLWGFLTASSHRHDFNLKLLSLPYRSGGWDEKLHSSNHMVGSHRATSSYP